MLSRVASRFIKSRGLRRSLKKVREEIGVARKHRRGVRLAKRYQSARGLKVNVGCGPNPKIGWLNIDLSDTADVTLDMREPIPLPDGSCVIIYSEHFFEHLDYPGDAMRFLSECHRLLEAGGKFSAGVPDTEWPIVSYANKENEYFEFVKNSGFHPSWCQTRMDNINFHFRQGEEHRYAYDYETFELILIQAGFTDVRRRKFDPEMDSPRRERGTLYIDAATPSSRPSTS